MTPCTFLSVNFLVPFSSCIMLDKFRLHIARREILEEQMHTSGPSDDLFVCGAEPTTFISSSYIDARP